MQNKLIENFQHENFVIIDNNYINLLKVTKYLLNFLIVYLTSVTIIYNYPSININQFILVICAVSVVSFYILDLYFPTCNI